MFVRRRGDAVGGGTTRGPRGRRAGAPDPARRPIAAAILAAGLLAAPTVARADPAGPDAARPFLGWSHSDDAPSSFYGATTLGAHRFGFAAGVGFPFLTATVAYGLLPTLDLRAGVATLYGSMTQVVVGSRLRIHRHGPFTIAARLGVDATVNRANDGSLKLTMHRDVDLTPGVVASVRLGSATFFADAGIDLSWDLSPAPVPLAGPPPPFTLGFQLPVHLGVELPFNANMAFVTRFGIDVPLTRTPVANATLPYVSVGLDLTG